ncbi:hypothetical protein DMN91_009791 [Ooceraea biroi]|uniref:Cytochrome P450 4g15 n=1 Tax=Ooceraea biroi TaxID=2015173 RepID=A0A026WMQ0_OOCBI|nr:cytochrome P450 4g15 [Ooceraea biroi]EZA56389.1 Cytochrome P450 4g15 [Ooceraea biroi]RLU17555.1 hypothetical protein DMN91_009791 [Ooceraea biroi]
MDVAVVMEETSYLTTSIYSVLLGFIAVLAALYYYIEIHSEGHRLIKKLPGPPSLPIIGHSLLTLGISSRLIFLRCMELVNQYGPVIGMYLGHRKCVALADPQDLEIILSSSVHINKAESYRFFKPWLGDGLLINEGEKWRRHRKIIAPTFHISILKSFVPLFYENSISLVKRLTKEVGKEFDCHDYLSATTVDILTETAMGVPLEPGQSTGHEFAKAVMEMSDITHRRHFDILLFFDKTFSFFKLSKLQKKLLKTIHTVTNRVIEKKSKAVDEQLRNAQQNEQKETQSDKLTKSTDAVKDTKNTGNNGDNHMKFHYVRDDLDDIDENDTGDKKRHAFLETMLILKKMTGQMTDQEVWDEVNTIMFEGHDTTAAGSSFTLCVLGSRPDIQARVHEEVDSIFGDSDRQCTFQDTLEMKYLERVILEALRHFPPVPIIARRLTENVKIVTGNYVIPKNAEILLAPYITHHLEKYYRNPYVFDPDNFLPEKMQNRHYYAYIPFSAGPRSCVGRKFAMLKLKVLLSTILRNYRIISDKSDNEFELRADIILKREDGFNIKIEPRKPMSFTPGQ